MAKTCPVCRNEVREPDGGDKGNVRIDFLCAHCGTELVLDLRLTLALTILCALPCIFFSYGYFPTFTFIIGDISIFIAFLLLFYPLRRISVKEK
jgi:hypothetical protein